MKFPVDKIKCEVCGKLYDFLPSHLRKSHGINTEEYRDEFDIPQGVPLASLSYRRAHSEKILQMKIDGRLNYNHLPDAVEASKKSKCRPKRGISLKTQIDTINKSMPWTKKQLPPGSKRADGRDADNARIYQQKYRAKKKTNGKNKFK